MFWMMQLGHAGAGLLGILLVAPMVMAATLPGRCSVSGAGDGWGVAGVRQDAATGREWTLLEKCGHPERPLRAVLTGAKVTTAARAAEPLAALVVAGRATRVTAHDGDLRMELTGTAEGSGRIGELVVVRLESFGAMETARRVSGVVNAAGEVEMR